MSAPNAAIRRTGQSLTPGDLVELYIVDLTPIGYNTQFAFTTSTNRKTALRYRGVDFVPLDVKCTGFEVSGEGTLPRPKLSVSNITRVMGSAAILYDDLIGATVTRIRTYAQFLDDGATPDPEAAYAPDIFRFHQKVEQNKRQITWVLAAATDQEGVMLPKRLVLKDICMSPYRRVLRNADGSFAGYDYSKAICPYAGSKAYDIDGNETTPEKDKPSRKVGTCCKVRFGAAAQLPFGGFPGVGRVAI